MSLKDFRRSKAQGSNSLGFLSTPSGTRTPNLLIKSQIKARFVLFARVRQRAVRFCPVLTSETFDLSRVFPSFPLFLSLGYTAVTRKAAYAAVAGGPFVRRCGTALQRTVLVTRGIPKKSCTCDAPYRWMDGFTESICARTTYCTSKSSVTTAHTVSPRTTGGTQPSTRNGMRTVSAWWPSRPNTS